MPELGDDAPRGLISGIVNRFLGGQLSILLIIAALALGAAAILLTPREEEPQIVVPLANIHVQFPGGSAEEVEKLVTTPLERLLWQVKGVEYVYSVSQRGRAVVSVRFYVGEDAEASITKLHHRIAAHMDQAPPGVAGWVVQPVEIDDVPIVSIALHSDRYDDHALRRIGEEVLARLDTVSDVSRTQLIGGRERVIRIDLDRQRLRARGVSALEVAGALRAADAALGAGAFDRGDHQIEVWAGPFLASVEDVRELVIGAPDGRPIYIRDVATVSDGPAEATSYSRIGKPGWDGTRPAVTIAVAKKEGTNAVRVADQVLARMDELATTVLPDGVDYTVTRNYGVTADDKVNELLSSLGFAMITVIGLLVFFLGWREGLIVALAVPISFALALFVNYISGYTINRVTLFALILTLGLVVDDPITNVDNIQRHILEGRRKPYIATLWAVQEVLPPVIMSTLAIIVSFTPMFFITGMMGPYMEPMAVNVPLTVIFSTIAALSIVPWAAYRLLRGRAPNDRQPGDNEQEPSAPPLMRRIYRTVVGPFLRARWARWAMIATIVVLLAGCGALVIFKLVPMKMLPFDNKNELQLVIDLPEGTTLERTDAVVRDFERYLFTVPEVTDFESFVGTHSPIDFNGMVRQYYFRRAPNQADIRINLVDKDRRSQQSHEIGLRLRRDLEDIAARHDATLALVESPPGPPVMATVVAEIYGPLDRDYADLLAAADVVRTRMADEPGLRDLDTTAETTRDRLDFDLDKEKAALHGIATADAVRVHALALSGLEPATVHIDRERTPLKVRVRFPEADRSGADELGQTALKGARGELVELHELGRYRRVTHDQPIYHKNLERVVYVMGEMAGRAPAEAILALGAHFDAHPLPQGTMAEWAGEGEWKITLRVFRDLGLAFGAAMVGIYILLVIQTGSFVMPMVVMSSIPLTAIGIMPGFWLLNLIADEPVGGFATPVFFTATAMIGMIALGGIVVRNSIVLIEFIQDRLAVGDDLRDAILASGAVRMRPILLTAATTALGAWPITLDPIFSGLAWALIFGLFASTAFTLLVVPVLYFMVEGRRHRQTA